MTSQMSRVHLLLHPQREPAKLRPAATVLLLRDAKSANGEPQLEVLMTRRSMTASFAPGAYVFPGGGIDATDAAAHPQANRRATQTDTQLTASIAAIRECFEELGVVLTESAFMASDLKENQSLVSESIDSGAIKNEVLAPLGYDRSQGFLAQTLARGDRLAADELYTFVHWVTDRDLPRRFDVPFLVARMPPNQTPVADESEQFEPIWISPAEALSRFEAGNFFIIFPTIRTLAAMKAFESVQALIDACKAEQPLWTSCPRAGLLNGQDSRHMSHEQPFGELEMVSPDGQICHELAWQSASAVSLRKHVRRLTAPNTSVMTGPGTNTYLIGTADSGYIVVDPGPAIQSHIDRIVAATGGDVRAIICTHSHPDHSPAATPLQRICEAANGLRAPIMGMASQGTARAHSQFVPDIELGESHQKDEHSAQWIRRPRADFDQNMHPTACLWAESCGPISLRVIHTPGHAANHVCLVLAEDGLLFSGDHVLNGSTTVIDPPDGNMGHYLASLDALMLACDTHAIAHILPAHGYVLGSSELPPKAIIAKLKAHRLAREAKIAAAMAQSPDGSLADWVAIAYQGTDKRLWPVAERSLLAHVEHIRQAQKS